MLVRGNMGNIIIIGHNVNQAAFKNWTPFLRCITRIDETSIDDAEDLDLVKPMYNFSEYSSNYSVTTGSLWFYSKYVSTTFNADIAHNKNNFKSFDHIGNIVAAGDNGTLKNATFVVPLKYLNNF